MVINPFVVSAGISAVGSLMGMSSNNKALKYQLEGVEFAIGEAKNDYIRKLASTYEQENMIDRETRDMLSARGLEAMKAEGRLRSGVSATGLTGSSMNEARNQTKYDQLFDNAVIISRSRKSKIDLSRERMGEYLQFKNQTQQYASTIPKPASTSTGSAIMAGLTTGLNIFSQGAMMGGTMKDLGFGASSTASTASTLKSTGASMTNQSLQSTGSTTGSSFMKAINPISGGR